MVFFSDIKNVGRYLANGVKSSMNGIRGVPKPVSVLPTKQPYLDTNKKIIVSKPVDIEGIYRDMSKEVAEI